MATGDPRPINDIVDERIGNILRSPLGLPVGGMGGISRRDIFAGLALMGYIGSNEAEGEAYETKAYWAVRDADALIAELDKPREALDDA